MDSNPSLTINCLYFELIHCLKYGAAAVFPTNRIRLGAQKPFWSLNPFLVNSNKAAKQAYWEWRALGKPRDSHPAFLLMKKRKAEFQAELRRHNNLVIEEASSTLITTRTRISFGMFSEAIGGLTCLILIPHHR